MEIYKNALIDNGKNVNEIEMPVLIASACVAKNRDIARMAAEEFMLRKHRDYAKRKGHRLYELLKKEGRDASELTFNDIADEVFLGGPDEAIEIVEKLKGLGANHIIFRLAWAGLTMEQSVLDSVKLIGEKVIPYFTQQ